MINNISFGSMFKMGGFSEIKETKETKKRKEDLDPNSRLLQEENMRMMNEINRQVLANHLASAEYLKRKEAEAEEELKAKAARREAEEKLSKANKEVLILNTDSAESWNEKFGILSENRNRVIDSIKRAPNTFKAVRIEGDRESTLYVYDENINTLTIYKNESRLELPLKSFEEGLYHIYEGINESSSEATIMW